ncbi:MAG: hypothetical protein AAB576_02395, partial [Elusimicrobiota bacterium]
MSFLGSAFAALLLLGSPLRAGQEDPIEDTQTGTDGSGVVENVKKVVDDVICATAEACKSVGKFIRGEPKDNSGNPNRGSGGKGEEERYPSFIQVGPVENKPHKKDFSGPLSGVPFWIQLPLTGKEVRIKSSDLAENARIEKDLISAQPALVPEKTLQLESTFERLQAGLPPATAGSPGLGFAPLLPVTVKEALATPAELKRTHLEVYDAYSDAYYMQAPQDPDANRARGVALLQQERYPEAESHLRFAIENGKADARTLTSYGGAAYGMRDFETAALSARLALKLDPARARANALLKLSE